MRNNPHSITVILENPIQTMKDGVAEVKEFLQFSECTWKVEGGHLSVWNKRGDALACFKNGWSYVIREIT